VSRYVAEAVAADTEMIEVDIIDTPVFTTFTVMTQDFAVES
jgi:hypothetical protein